MFPALKFPLIQEKGGPGPEGRKSTVCVGLHPTSTSSFILYCLLVEICSCMVTGAGGAQSSTGNEWGWAAWLGFFILQVQMEIRLHRLLRRLNKVMDVRGLCKTRKYSLFEGIKEPSVPLTSNRLMWTLLLVSPGCLVFLFPRKHQGFIFMLSLAIGAWGHQEEIRKLVINKVVYLSYPQVCLSVCICICLSAYPSSSWFCFLKGELEINEWQYCRQCGGCSLNSSKPGHRQQPPYPPFWPVLLY